MKRLKNKNEPIISQKALIGCLVCWMDNYHSQGPKINLVSVQGCKNV